MFSKKNISTIPLESTPHSNGSRKMIVSKNDITSQYFEALTYGILPAGESWKLHNHDNIIEICIVIKGKGVMRDGKGNIEQFTIGDRFIFPSNTDHEIENTSTDDAYFYFFRLQDQ